MLNVYSPYYVKYDIPGIARTSGYRLGYASAISISKSAIIALCGLEGGGMVR